MPLPLLLVLVIGGIAAVVLLVHLVGWSKPLTLTEETAREEFKWDNPGAEIRDVALSGDGKAALIELSGGRLGFIEVLGDGTVSRILEAAAPARVDRSGARLAVALDDFTDPSLALTFATEAEAEKWAARLAGGKDSH